MLRGAIVVLALLVAVFSPQCHATLPADNGGAATYAAGDIAPKIAVECANFSDDAASDNYTLVPKKGASLIILSVSLGNSSDRTGPDLFVQNMVNSNTSLDAFLGSDAVGSDATGNASFLFVIDAQTDDEAAAAATALHSRLAGRALAKNHSVASALANLHFAVQSTSSAGALANVLRQWTTPVTSISFPTVDGGWTVSRLDGKYEACQWPSENQALANVVDGGDGCQSIPKGKFNGKWVVLSNSGCSAAEVLQHSSSSGATGTIIAAANGAQPEELQSCSRGLATMISYDDGVALQTTLKEEGSLNATFFSARRKGAFVAVDGNGRLQEVGWEKYSTLEMLAWSAQYLDYLQELDANLTKPHYSVPIFDHAFGGAAVITLPPASFLEQFGTMEIDHRLTCADSPRMDESCPAWDHNIALGVLCAPTAAEAARLADEHREMRVGDLGVAVQQQLGEPGGFVGEMARYITPFRRRVGHWLTPSTARMPYLTDTVNRSCAFQLSGPGGWASTISLRFSDADGPPPPQSTTQLFMGGSFDKNYNKNRTLIINPPRSQQARSVELSFILSGHGQCEFMATTHVFTVNGVDFRWSSEGVAGTGELPCMLCFMILP
eukprot:COSAG02_NODE_4367_length_5445_cov_2.017770_3_plen_610_part_00